MSAFSADTFRAQCSSAAQEAAKGSGCSDVLWQARLNSAVDALLATVPQESLPEAEQIARGAGWLPVGERTNERFDGACVHGFPDNCCPLGCDDREA